MNEPGEARMRRMRCVVGHDIPTDEIDRLTRMETMDKGAEALVCVEHGAPIAMILEPDDTRSSHR